MSLNLVFMGTPNFSVPALESLIKNNCNILKVYTQPPKKSKRGQKINPSPVEEFCKENKIKFTNPQNLNTDEELKIFKELFPDIVIVVAYGQIISKRFLEIPKLGFLNIHASLLPKWRGAAPIQRAIMNRDEKIGVSIMKIKEQLDSGPVLISQELKLEQNTTHGEAENILSKLGADLLIKSLNIIKKGNPKFVEQIDSKATYAKKIEKNETKINWNLDAVKVLSHIHSLSPKPGAWFEFKKERFKILKAQISKLNGKVGTVLDENLSIACKSNSVKILELQRAGKKKQTTKEFLLGNKIIKNSILD